MQQGGAQAYLSLSLLRRQLPHRGSHEDGDRLKASL